MTNSTDTAIDVDPPADADPAGLDTATELFWLAKQPDSVRDQLLDSNHLAVAFRMSWTSPDAWPKLLRALKGWSGLRTFRERIDEHNAMRRKRRKNDQISQWVEKARDAGTPIISDDPPTAARDFINERMPNLIRYGEEWLEYRGTHYRAIKSDAVESVLQAWMAAGVDSATGEAYRASYNRLREVLNAVKNVAYRDDSEPAPPAWLDPWPEVDPDPAMTISLKDGLLDSETGMLMPHSPNFFTRNAVPFDFRQSAGPPIRWHLFLESIWPEYGTAIGGATAAGNAQNKRTLQEIMGYCLTGDTRFQKIFGLFGPGRSGKGTIIRVLTELVGSANAVPKTVDELGQQFGLQELIGKQLVTIAELRFGKGANSGGIMSAMLSISGQDPIAVQRKFTDNWSGRLNTKLLVAANKELTMPDQSGAFAARLLPLVMHESFIGREDWDLFEKLEPELPQIFAWAIEGLERLLSRVDENGRRVGFILPPDSRGMLAKIRRESSTVQAFVAEVCDLDEAATCDKHDIFSAFEGWARQYDLPDRYMLSTFAKEIYAASGYRVTSARPGSGSRRGNVFVGIRIKPEYEGHPWPSPFED